MPDFDLAVIGGGIAGLGVFECAGRAGLKAVLLERGLPGGETTAVTSSLLHGGLRYLPHDAPTSLLMCREISRIRRERADLLKRQAFLWPVYSGEFLRLGLIEALQAEYDLLAPLRGARVHARLSAAEAARVQPGLKRDGLLGAVAFDEWRVDVPRLVSSLVESGRAAGGELWEGWEVSAMSVRGGAVASISAEDGRGERREVSARICVNAAGPWAEEVARLAGVSSVRLRLRKGAHLVIEGPPPPHGLIFRGPGGRRLGVYPRDHETWVGPTDEPHEGPPGRVEVSEAEISEIRRSLSEVLPELASRPCRAVAGLRPILMQGGASFLLSREHRVFDHSSEGVENFISIAGGKLTTYRPMGLDVLSVVLKKLGQARTPVVADREAGLPWTFRHSHGRLIDALSSVVLLAYFVVRRIFSGSGREGWAAFEGDKP